MGSETSEKAMGLLKELPMLKKLDTAYEATPTEGDLLTADHLIIRNRVSRCLEV